MSRARDYFILQSRRELDKIRAITRDTYHEIAVVLGVDLRVLKRLRIAHNKLHMLAAIGEIRSYGACQF